MTWRPAAPYRRESSGRSRMIPVIKWAYNASFERVCLSVWLRRNYPQHFSSYSIEGDTVRNYLAPSSWRCSLVWGAYMGLPLSLEGIGKVLKLENQKMSEGKALIRYFCVPCKPTKANGGRTRNLPEHDPVKWSTFISYNKRDVETEMAIQQKLSKFPVPGFPMGGIPSRPGSQRPGHTA